MTDLLNLRGWPGLDAYKPPRSVPRSRPRIAERESLVLFAAGEAAQTTERVDLDAIEDAHAWEAAVLAAANATKRLARTADKLGLGAFLVIAGPSIHDAGLIVADELAERDPEALAGLRAWAKANPVQTDAGRRPWCVVTVAEFCDPEAGVMSRPPRGVGVFLQRAYSGTGFVIGADLGRSLGLLAEYITAGREPSAARWDLWLPGWGHPTPKGPKRLSPHRPQLRLTSRRVGWSVDFAPCKQGFGKYVDGHRWRGAFVDLPALAYALDANRGASFSEHRQAFELEAADLPVCVGVDASGAEAMAEAVRVLHETALVLDDHAARWFTSAEDRALGRAHLDVARTTSPGALAAQMLARSGVRAPLEKFQQLDDTEHLRWAEAFHGGWCSWEDRLLGVPFPSVEADLSSAYPLVAHHLGWWPLLCAARLDREDVTAELRAACERAVADPTSCLDPALWRRLGFTLAEVLPNGEPWPVELDDPTRPDGRFEVVPVGSPDQPMRFAWPDVVAAAARSGSVPEIRSATRLVPVGRQIGLRRRLPLLPDLVLDLAADDTSDDTSDDNAAGDPAVALVRHRRKLKATGLPADKVLAAELRVVVNAAVFGNAARFDAGRRKVGRKRWATSERPGPWTFMPLASTVTAGARLLLGLLDKLVVDAGGTVAYRDTDSSFIPASPAGASRDGASRDGGEMMLADGSKVKLLSYSQVDSMLARFDALRISDDWPVWTTKRGTDGSQGSQGSQESQESQESQLRSLVIAPKRHISFRADGQGIEIVGRTDANLGGTFVDPPTLKGRAPDGLRAWSRQVAERAALNALAGPLTVEPEPWAVPAEGRDFGAFRRRKVSTPSVLKSLPPGMGARLGSRFVEANESDLGGAGYGAATGRGGRSFVALDPGGDLAGWRSLIWFDRASGRRIWPTEDFDRSDSVRPFLMLAEVANRWWRSPPWTHRVESVRVDPLLLRHVGRVSGVLDAGMAGLNGDLAGERPEYDLAEVWARRREVVAKYAAALGPRRLAARAQLPLKTAERAALGQRIAKATVMRALRNLKVEDLETRRCGLDGCGHPVFRANGRYCDCSTHGNHRWQAQKRRQRERVAAGEAASNPESTGAR